MNDRPENIVVYIDSADNLRKLAGILTEKFFKPLVHEQKRNVVAIALGPQNSGKTTFFKSICKEFLPNVRWADKENDHKIKNPDPKDEEEGESKLDLLEHSYENIGRADLVLAFSLITHEDERRKFGDPNLAYYKIKMSPDVKYKAKGEDKDLINRTYRHTVQAQKDSSRPISFSPEARLVRIIPSSDPRVLELFSEAAKAIRKIFPDPFRKTKSAPKITPGSLVRT
jgi:hypothetical protein